jgi:Ca2+-binding EF-hand superfamily protein
MFDPGEMISRLDQNGNGQIDPEEMQGPARFFLERAARDNNLDLTKPIPTAKLREAMQARFQQGGGGGGNRGGGSSNGNGGSNGSSAPTKTVIIAPNAFGVDKPLTPVPGFGGAPSADSWEAIKAKYDQRIVQRVEEMLIRMDKNKDGILHAEEIKSGQWRGDPKESDVNKDGTLTRSELAERQRLRDQNGGGGGGPSGGFMRGGGFPGGGFPGGDFNGGFPRGGGGFSGGPSGSSGGSGSSSSGNSTRSASTTVAAVPPYRVYGAANPSASAAKIGVPATTPSSAAPATTASAAVGATAASAPPPAAIPQVVLDFADGTIKENDVNKDGTLDGEEVAKMSSRRRKADINADGKITRDELIAYQMGFQSSSPTSSSVSVGSVNYGGRVASTKGIKTYRFLTPIERMPQGLPDWFVRSDANGDGQVSMAEFSSSWDDAKAAEFTRWDRNGDGFVTTREATAAK